MADEHYSDRGRTLQRSRTNTTVIADEHHSDRGRTLQRSLQQSRPADAAAVACYFSKYDMHIYYPVIQNKF